MLLQHDKVKIRKSAIQILEKNLNILFEGKKLTFIWYLLCARCLYIICLYSSHNNPVK